MYDYPVEQQILDIREVCSKAAETKESALKFLHDAGIIKGKSPQTEKKQPTSISEKKK